MTTGNCVAFYLKRILVSDCAENKLITLFLSHQCALKTNIQQDLFKQQNTIGCEAAQSKNIERGDQNF